MSALVGSAVFASLARDVGPWWVRLAVAGMSVAAAVLTSLQTFLGFGERADRHRTAAAKFSALKKQIETELALPPGRGEVKACLVKLQRKYGALTAGSPTLPERLVRRTKSLSGKPDSS